MRKNILKENVDINKKVREQKAITLIALVITIIVLLILAGVTIAMLTGKNGILSKAGKAKEESIKAQYEEELNLILLEMQTEKLGSLTMENIIKELPTYIQKKEINDYEWDTTQEAEEPIGVYKSYNFYIDKNKKAHIGEMATGMKIICEVDPKGWTNQQVTAKITIKSNNGLKSIMPTGETAIDLNGEKEHTITKTGIDKNTTYTYEITDTQGNKETKTISITNIDKLPPKDFTITAVIEDGKVKIGGIETTDADATSESANSGIQKYEYIVTNSSNVEVLKEELTEEEITQKKVEKEMTTSGEYKVKVIAYDNAGNPKTSNEVQVQIYSGTLSSAAKKGDFVNYDAGNWTTTVGTPTSNGGFGDYTAGTSKNAKISKYACSYAGGWRVLSISGTTVSLVHAGSVASFKDWYGCGVNDQGTKLLNNFCNNNFVNVNYATSAREVTIADMQAFKPTPDPTHSFFYGNDNNEYQYHCANFYNAWGDMSTSNSVQGVRPVVVLKAGIEITGKADNGYGQQGWELKP